MPDTQPAQDAAPRIVFVIDVEPLNERDFIRTQHKVADVIRELREDGVQVRSNAMAIMRSRDLVLEALER